MLLAFDDRQALAGEDEEALLVGLAVVHGDGLAGPHDREVEAELVEVLVALEVARDAERTLLVPVRVADVRDVPGHAMNSRSRRASVSRAFRSALRRRANGSIRTTSPSRRQVPATNPSTRNARISRSRKRSSRCSSAMIRL